MKGYLLLLLLFFPFVAGDQPLLFIEGTLHPYGFDLSSLTLGTGSPSPLLKSGNYRFQLLSENGGNLYEGYESFSFYAYAYPVDVNESNAGGRISLEDVPVSLRIPWYGKPEMFRISRMSVPEEIVFSTSLLPELCGSKDGVCLTYCPIRDPDCSLSEETDVHPLVVGGLLVFVLVLLVVGVSEFRKRR